MATQIVDGSHLLSNGFTRACVKNERSRKNASSQRLCDRFQISNILPPAIMNKQFTSRDIKTRSQSLHSLAATLTPTLRRKAYYTHSANHRYLLLVTRSSANHLLFHVEYYASYLTPGLWKSNSIRHTLLSDNIWQFSHYHNDWWPRRWACNLVTNVWNFTSRDTSGNHEEYSRLRQLSYTGMCVR